MIRRALKGWRHPLRIVAMAMAALSLSWGVAPTEGIVAAMLGAVLGVIAGEVLGRGRLRTAVIQGATVILCVASWQAASLSTSTELLAATVGPGNALVFASVLRFASLALFTSLGLRALAVRRPWALALELGAVAGAFTAAFASHREGVIARPLWLSDWAWQQGIDPTTILLGIGGVAVVLLAVLLVAESKSGRGLSSLLTLLALATSAVLLINVVGAPAPPPMSEIAMDDAGRGQPPRPSDGGDGRDPRHGDGGDGRDPNGADGGRGGTPDGGGDGGGASRSDGGDGGGSSAADGGDGGGGGGFDAGEGGLPPPSMSDGGVGMAPPPQDAGPRRPPPSERLSEDQAPSNSPAPMAVVILDDDYSPPSGAYYFRQEVWSQFNGTRLISTRRSDVDHDIVLDFPTLTTRAQDVPPASGRTRVHAMVALLVEHSHPFALESPVSYQPVANPNPQRFARAWRFESLSQTIDYRRLLNHRAGSTAWSPEVRAYYLEGPTDPRFHQLAERIVRERLPARLRRDPFARALAIKLWMDHEFTYSTRHRHAGVPDPTADFLFGNRTGYCVHFAHSAVFLWRSLGIPSRVSTGYHSDESNRRGGSTILLRGGDAHAWPELYLDGYGWIVLDIAPERNLDPPGNAPDEDLQRILGEMARQQPPDPTQTPQEQQRRPQRRVNYGRMLGLGALALVAATLALLYAIKLWRRVIPRFAGSRQLPRVGYRRALDMLAEAGISREEGESREAFAKRVGERAPTLAKLTEWHLSARLGDPSRPIVDREEFSRPAWRDALRALSRELPKTTRRWRRALGFINPASFLDAR